MDSQSAIRITAPSGELEAIFVQPDRATRAIVSCHPHPQFGGSMHDAVIDTIEQTARGHRWATLKFNFRGVGGSSGRFDNGVGEVDDLLAAIAWLRERMGSIPIGLAGYSFGSNIAWRSIDRAGPLAGVVLIAPPVSMMDFSARQIANAPVHLIAGDRDDYVDTAELRRWAHDAIPTASVDIVTGADHFFSGGHDELARVLDRVLT